jgi:hypothetical protein
MHLTDSDFENFTQGGKLCGSKGELGPREFERVMREQVPFASPPSTTPLRWVGFLPPCPLSPALV